MKAVRLLEKLLEFPRLGCAGLGTGNRTQVFVAFGDNALFERRVRVLGGARNPTIIEFVNRKAENFHRSVTLIAIPASPHRRPTDDSGNKVGAKGLYLQLGRTPGRRRLLLKSQDCPSAE
jgi:hypothetical protein